MHIRKNKGKHIMHFKTWRCRLEQFGTIGKLKMLPHKKTQLKQKNQITNNLCRRKLCHSPSVSCPWRREKWQGRGLSPCSSSSGQDPWHTPERTTSNPHNYKEWTLFYWLWNFISVPALPTQWLQTLLLLAKYWQFQLCPVRDYTHFCSWHDTDPSSKTSSKVD